MRIILTVIGMGGHCMQEDINAIVESLFAKELPGLIKEYDSLVNEWQEGHFMPSEYLNEQIVD